MKGQASTRSSLRLALMSCRPSSSSCRLKSHWNDATRAGASAFIRLATNTTSGSRTTARRRVLTGEADQNKSSVWCLRKRLQEEVSDGHQKLNAGTQVESLQDEHHLPLCGALPVRHIDHRLSAVLVSAPHHPAGGTGSRPGAAAQHRRHLQAVAAPDPPRDLQLVQGQLAQPELLLVLQGQRLQSRTTIRIKTQNQREDPVPESVSGPTTRQRNQNQTQVQQPGKGTRTRIRLRSDNQTKEPEPESVSGPTTRQRNQNQNQSQVQQPDKGTRTRISLRTFMGFRSPSTSTATIFLYQVADRFLRTISCRFTGSSSSMPGPPPAAGSESGSKQTHRDSLSCVSWTSIFSSTAGSGQPSAGISEKLFPTVIRPRSITSACWELEFWGTMMSGAFSLMSMDKRKLFWAKSFTLSAA
ncbi:hypothetical protein F7725_025725 [Dissostichus mawsoni]|uniref:Uncharacterized protein n=1 Tax=Dissostichus mawsoni TaxID=36200 RepID=A0A7J5X514_DISMA|nr:hypothetical protein F7725_025725 [Dissostichus mawsoni]